jgi:hypothetical protein
MTTLSKQDCIEAVKQVVVDILNDFGLPTSGIGPSTVPHKIEQFDSDIGIFGTVMASGATKIDVPLNESLFSDRKGKPLTIEQAAERLVDLQTKQARKRSPNGEVGVA